ncbi:MAG: hypothetical protein KF886_13750 [Candidatus Hydrogenedentes bacterium]|nr:hypothetical protein [Candidatus Hydrogenedentota bacterium]
MLSLSLLLAQFTNVLSLAAPPFPGALDRAAIAVETLDNIVEHGLLLGNGDMNALVHAEGDDLIVRLTKNDVWDARIPTELDPPLPRFAEILKLDAPDGPVRSEGGPNSGFILPRGYSFEGPDSYHANAYPCPRACAVVRIPDAARPPLTATLDLRRAVLTVAAAGVRTTLHIDARANRLIVETTSASPSRLEPVVSDDLDPPDTGARDDLSWVAQDIPGDADWPGMRFRVVLAQEGGRTAVSIGTSLDGANPEDIVRAAFPATGMEAHERAWSEFWSRSGIKLDDALLEQTWYRNLYFLRCVSRPGVQAPGLFAGLINDKPAWHGDYHTNYNIQQTFWGAYISNHDELAEPYARLIREYLPRAQWLCRTVFEWDGAFFPHVLYAYEPPHPEQCKAPNGRQYLHHVWGFTMGVTPFTVQPVWWHYQYYPDRRFLEETAYPLVREAANFCAGFVERCARSADGAIDFGPSVSPEHWTGWPEGFSRNYDGAFDIAFFHFIFDAALEGGGILDTDGDLAARWCAARDQLPDYPVTGGNEPIVVDVRGAPPIEYNIPVPATPVFPAGVVGWQSPESQRQLFARTIAAMQTNGNNSAVMLAAARGRLDMPDKVPFLRGVIQERLRANGSMSLNALNPPRRFNDYGLYTEQFGVVLPISELLLQSAGGVIRVFPAWPPDQAASFEQLRAEGGFLVSAKHDGEEVTEIRVRSTAGGNLRLQPPWAGTPVVRGADSIASDVAENGAILLRVMTEPGQELIFARP